jgi:hypothetical protein
VVKTLAGFQCAILNFEFLILNSLPPTLTFRGTPVIWAAKRLVSTPGGCAEFKIQN